MSLALPTSTAPVTIIKGDCLDVLPELPENSVDSLVTDSPYGLGIAGEAWDRSGVAFQPRTWERGLRALKPGGNLISFGATRTYHRMACAIEDASWEIRDQLDWLYGTGKPNGKRLEGGRSTMLKPAHEMIVLARKPGPPVGLYIDACRVPRGERGSTPTNVLLTHAPSCSGVGCVEHCPVKILDAQSGHLKSGKMKAGTVRSPVKGARVYGDAAGGPSASDTYADEGGASRFFPTFEWDQQVDVPFLYCAKTSRSEKEAGLGDLAQTHPTVKPVALMQWLCRLVTPPGGIILDPFLGSGTTAIAAVREGFRCIGIEKDEEGQYIEIAQRRINHELGGE